MAPPEIHLRAAPSPVLLDLEEFANTPIHFNQSRNAIKIPKSFLIHPLQAPGGGPDLASDRVYDILQQSAPAADFSESLQQLIRSLLRQGYPDVALAAEATGLSLRSFQRHLTDLGLSYSDLVKRVRFDLAVAWLADPSLKLADIANSLGYSDLSNFTSAFKGWTGVSPRQYRQLQQRGEG